MRNITGLKRGGPGRPKGVANRATVEVKQMCSELVEDPQYRARLKERLWAGDLPPALECLIWHYAFGRPKETMGIDSALAARESHPRTLTQVNVTEVYLDRLSTAQLDELDRLLEVAGLPAPNGPLPPPMVEPPK